MAQDIDDSTSSSGSDSEQQVERRRNLKERMAQFKAKKAEKERLQPKSEPETEQLTEKSLLVCQLHMVEDYAEYTGITGALRSRGWLVVGSDGQTLGQAPGELEASAADRVHAEGDKSKVIPDLQWCPYRRTAWTAVLKGHVVANHYFMRSALVRKAQLARTLLPSLIACLPETHVADLESRQSRDQFSNLLEQLSSRGAWILKPGDSSNATDMHIFRGAEGLADAKQTVMTTERQSWLVQRYIERPLLVLGRKFHIRALVLAVGRLKVYLHKRPIALLASEPYHMKDFANMLVHASNHSVQERGGGKEDSVLLSDLHAQADSPPPIQNLLQSSDASAASDRQEAGTPQLSQEQLETMRPQNAAAWHDAVWDQLAEMVRRIFISAVQEECRAKGDVQVQGNTGPKGFLPLPCCFEIFGLDAMIDNDGRVWLLELNCDPDFKVYSERHRDIAQDAMSDCLDLIAELFSQGATTKEPPSDAVAASESSPEFSPLTSSETGFALVYQDELKE